MTEQALPTPVESPSVPGGNGAVIEPKKDSVAYETHQKLLGEKKRVQADLDVLLKAQEERERKELESKGEYQKLLENERKKAEEADTKFKSLQSEMIQGRKGNAILKALDHGVDPKFFAFLPLDQVLLDPDTGEINQTSVAKAAENFRKDFPELLKGKNGPQLPNAAPQGSALTISRDEWEKLKTSNEMKKWKQHQIIG